MSHYCSSGLLCKFWKIYFMKILPQKYFICDPIYLKYHFRDSDPSLCALLSWVKTSGLTKASELYFNVRVSDHRQQWYRYWDGNIMSWFFLSHIWYQNLPMTFTFTIIFCTCCFDCSPARSIFLAKEHELVDTRLDMVTTQQIIIECTKLVTGGERTLLCGVNTHKKTQWNGSTKCLHHEALL